MQLRTVLIVDDSEADQYLNRFKILERLPDAEIRTAYDGVQALTALRESDYVPDLILLDINMPRMNGFEFLEIYVDEFENSASSVVLMLTSSLLAADQERARSYAPVRGLIRKPLDESWPEMLSSLLHVDDVRVADHSGWNIDRLPEQCDAEILYWRSTDVVGAALSVSNAAEMRRIWGLSKDAAITREALYAQIHPNDIPTVRESRTQASACGGSDTVQFRIRFEQGWRAIGAKFRSVNKPSGQFSHVTGACWPVHSK